MSSKFCADALAKLALCTSKFEKTSVLLENTLAISRVLSDKTLDIINYKK